MSVKIKTPTLFEARQAAHYDTPEVSGEPNGRYTLDARDFANEAEAWKSASLLSTNAPNRAVRITSEARIIAELMNGATLTLRGAGEN